jgi:hypothetical protein
MAKAAQKIPAASATKKERKTKRYWFVGHQRSSSAPTPQVKALLEQLRKDRNRGDPRALLYVVDFCLRTGTKVPLWAAQEFCDRIDQWFRSQVATLDEAFGVQAPKGEHFKSRKQGECRWRMMRSRAT